MSTSSAVGAPVADPLMATVRTVDLFRAGEWTYASGMRRILLRSAEAYLLLAVSARAADALGVGGVRFHCGCDESCWCKRPGLTLLRWVTPRVWHQIGLTPDEKRARSGR